jgi:branched-chain amino acid transport system permease protein
MTAMLRSRSTLAIAFFVLVMALSPLVLSTFNIERVAAEVLFLAIIGLSFTFLSSLVGMVSLAQTALAAAAGYTVAYGTTRGHWPIGVTLVAAIAVAAVIGALFGLVATRTTGISFLVITLAMGLMVNKFALQNKGITNGFTGINAVHGPKLLGLNLDKGVHRFYAELAVGTLLYLGLRAIASSHFGATLAAIRDNPTRMKSLGYAVQLHRIVAFVIAAVVAAIGGIFAVWYRVRIDPTSANLSQAINLLIICVLGGIARLEGAVVGAALFVVLRTYAANVTDRFNTLIGAALLAVALGAPDGLTGLGTRMSAGVRNRRGRLAAPLTQPAVLLQGETQ